MKNVYAVKLQAVMPSIKIIEKKDGDDVLSFCYREIGCEMIEIPPMRHLKAPYILICDEEGLLKEDSYLNWMGSYLYGILDHGEAIVGDAIVMKERGEEITWMSKEEAEQVLRELAGEIVPAIEAILQKNAR